MPASTLPVSTWVSTDFTSGCRVTGLTVIPAFLNTSAATDPHGTCGWHSATLTECFARSFTESTFAGLFGGTATSAKFLAKFCGLDASPADTTSCIVPGDAEANTSAGAPLVISVARPELGPKLNFTVSPLWAASNCLPSWVKLPVSDAAAKTVIDPVEDELPEPDEFDELEPPLLQPATVTAASAAIAKAKRRISTPKLNLGRGQPTSGISTDTLVALTVATASIPGSRPSSSAASRLTRPLNLFRAECATTTLLAPWSADSARCCANRASAAPSTASRPEESVVVWIR